MVSKHPGESWCQNHLPDQELFQLFEKVDTELTEEARLKGCLLCGGKLHRSDYRRKPRGGPSTSVEHQAQQRQVSAAIVRINVDRLEHCLYFIKIQMFDYARNRALERNA